MKTSTNRIKFYVAAAIMGISALIVPTASAIGKGEKSVGINGGFASYNESGYLTASFQYAWADHFRLAPEIGFVFPNNHNTGFVLDADIQFPFRIAKGFGIYPLAGLAFNNWSHKTPSGSDNISRFGLNIGAGCDIYLTNSFKLTIEAKYSMMQNTSGVFAGLGFNYLF